MSNLWIPRCCTSTEDSLASKGFVDFEEIDILERQTRSFQDSRMAYAWPTPMMRGGTPTVEAEMNLQRMERPRHLATERRTSRTVRYLWCVSYEQKSPYPTDKNEKIKWCIEEEGAIATGHPLGCSAYYSFVEIFLFWCFVQLVPVKLRRVWILVSRQVER